MIIVYKRGRLKVYPCVIKSHGKVPQTYSLLITSPLKQNFTSPYLIHIFL